MLWCHLQYGMNNLLEVYWECTACDQHSSHSEALSPYCGIYTVKKLVFRNLPFFAGKFFHKRTSFGLLVIKDQFHFTVSGSGISFFYILAFFNLFVCSGNYIFIELPHVIIMVHIYFQCSFEILLLTIFLKYVLVNPLLTITCRIGYVSLCMCCQGE